MFCFCICHAFVHNLKDWRNVILYKPYFNLNYLYDLIANNRGLRIHQGRKKDMSTPATAEGGPDTPAQNGGHHAAGEQQRQTKQTKKDTCSG